MYNKIIQLNKLIWYYVNSKIRTKREVRDFYDRHYKFQFLKHFNTDTYKEEPYHTSIDVLIPAIERDLNVLEYCITNLRKHSLNPIGNIYIVAPNTSLIKKFAVLNSCQYVDERTVSSVMKSKIDYKFDIFDRSGWLFQQILKLNWNKVSKNKYCLIFDSDTILTSPHLFVNDNIIRFNCSDEYHKAYFETFNKMFGFKANYNLSFVSHYMLFERETTRMMKSEIENYSGLNWEEAILKYCNYNNISGFSEYETYANYMLKRHRRMMKINYWYNCSISVDKLDPIVILETEQKLDNRSLSFHWYKDQIDLHL